MNKEEFLRQLNLLLRDIPESERREAMEFYQSYFEDAGPEKEQQIIEELGSPQEVASSIRKNLFGEHYEDYDFVKPEQSCGHPKKSNAARSILIAVILVLTFPFWIAVAASVFGLLVAGAACVFSLIVVVIVLAGVFLILGIVFGGVGMGQILTGFPAIGLMLVGLGMLMLAVSILSMIATLYVAIIILPWVTRAFIRLCKRPFQKRGASI